MNKIVQLNKREYNELVEKAEITDCLINERAQKLYEKKGMYGIVIEINPNTDDYNRQMEIKNNAHFKYTEDKFLISYYDKRKIIEFVNMKVAKIVENKFGRQISDRNFLVKKISEIRKLRLMFICVTILGWLLATGMIIINCLTI